MVILDSIYDSDINEKVRRHQSLTSRSESYVAINSDISFVIESKNFGFPVTKVVFIRLPAESVPILAIST